MKTSTFLAFSLLFSGMGMGLLAEEVADQPVIAAEETVAAPENASTTTSTPAPAVQPKAAPVVDIKPMMQTVKSNFKKENFEAADKAVDMALELKPDDFEANKYKGMCQYKLGNLDAAEKAFKLAWTADSKDAELVFYVGSLQDKKGNSLAAEKQFLRYKEFGIFNGYASKMKKYASYVSAKAAKQRAAQALQQEASLDATNIAPNSVAVVTFANTGSDKDLDPLQKGLAEMVATDLSKVERLKVIERVQMQALVNEMALGQTGLLEEKNAERFGKLVGAEKVVNGSFASNDNATIKMDAGFADVKNGELKAIESQNGQLADIFKLEKALVLKVVDQMGIVLTDKERKAIAKVPTENVLAFLSYSKGLDAEDKGDFATAQGLYAEAVKADPKFSQAQTAANAAGVKNDCSKSGDLTKVTASAPVGGGSEITTPVYTINNLNFSARGTISLYTLNSVNSSFMPEKAVSVATEVLGSNLLAIPKSSGNIERISYIDAFGLGFGSASAKVKISAPIPDDGN
ncbi:MAG: hypothetical protein A2293_02330 [Elusimicrobia bacterium RIFOXYB2_FULL_49_7]|nr:MAG: hypothetical protein A2293_02330 [Elusimicrobia bacterium RIFOXYB2_FULL_49_7]